MFCLQFVVFCLLLAKIKTWRWKAMCSCDKPTPRKWNWTCVQKVLKTWIQSRTDVQETNIFYLMRLNLVRIVIQNMTKLPKYLLSWLWTFYFHYAPNFSHLTSLRLSRTLLEFLYHMISSAATHMQTYYMDLYNIYKLQSTLSLVT